MYSRKQEVIIHTIYDLKNKLNITLIVDSLYITLLKTYFLDLLNY